LEEISCEVGKMEEGACRKEGGRLEGLSCDVGKMEEGECRKEGGR
jgi:hypothetical protein